MSAEAIVEQHYAAKGWGKPTKLILYPNVPSLFRAEFADGIDYVLVDEAALVLTKGLKPMGAYMRKVDLLSREVELQELLTLILVFDAYPPTTDGVAKNAFYDGPEHPSLKPVLDREQRRLVLNYLPSPKSAGGRQNPKLMELQRWTLRIPKDYALTWSVEAVNFEIGKP